ncbi:prevent-host-death family protein [Nitrospirillum viridazoti Y2]|uniref:Antitoxin n=1 Tax=Nitrospirillum amazonense TaxID=28077 RepID=A0A560HNP5_9PROT|nr:type II toxin-antitoxin system prevent-host-death family antitoxin [Nitrospirillum amazonense]EGY00686.1 prevent-host-death family protein [Nitrospirillum amazonense Y2]TWB48187.1 prevent-host-death family protein [Nitrospirillum amazonense]
MRLVPSTEANRKFSELLRRVTTDGETFTVTIFGKPVATIAPVSGKASRKMAKAALLERLDRQPATNASWTRDELYDDED